MSVQPVATSFVNEQIILDALPQPVLAIAPDWSISYANFAAQEFFRTSLKTLKQRTLNQLLPFGSPVIDAVERCLREMVSLNKYNIDLPLRTDGQMRIIDLYVSSVMMNDMMMAILIIQPRSIATHLDRQLTHRGAARSVSAMSAILAHEIKNPLSGIKGAAQLLEGAINAENTELTRLICDETDRIVGLVDRFEEFGDAPTNMDMAVNMHAILENVRLLAASGFAQHVRFEESYDPSLPLVRGNKDMLMQVFINLVKNAAQATQETHKIKGKKAEIKLQSAFVQGVHLAVPNKAKGQEKAVSLPLEFRVIDNGAGVPDDIKAHLFAPFVTSKTNGTGLGLALVAKIIGDHGGTIECNSQPGRTEFCIRLPMATMGAMGEIK